MECDSHIFFPIFFFVGKVLLPILRKREAVNRIILVCWKELLFFFSFLLLTEEFICLRLADR